MANSWQSQNYRDHFLRHSDYRLRIDRDDGSELFGNDATFEERPGLDGGNGVTYESVNAAPGFFIRHRNFELWLDYDEDRDEAFRKDATFLKRPGLADPAGVSFESVNFPGHFIRHQNLLLFLHKNDGSDLFKNDATFRLHRALRDTPRNQPPMPGPPPTGLVTAQKVDMVGNRKRMTTKVTQYRNGLLVIETFTDCFHRTEGLRGKVCVVCRDASGNAIWVSKDFACTTRCSTFDPSCASKGTDTFREQFPEPVGRFTTALDIYHSERDNLRDFRQQTIAAIKGTGEVAAEVKAVLGALI